jgi:hypothetical protein
MPNYNNSKIYKIVSPSNPDLIYYGSTVQKLCDRMSGHRRDGNKTRAKEIINLGDAIILLVENFSCNSKEELLKKEGEYILNNDCINRCVAGRTIKEYREDNKDKINAYIELNKDKIRDKQKQYRELNKDKIRDQRKQYRELNKDKIRDQRKKFKDERVQYDKQYAIDNKEKISERRKKKYYENKNN